ncbi:hypothetical protein [Brevundimonas sp. CEF1]|uniref:hypothetical protein n=1 Tax=Brevundimonas sp. CEF1 TaxID=3442642 RepID=UPI003F51A25D
MITTISQGIVLLTGVWLIGISLMMLAAPRRALRALSAMGGSNAVHFGELGLRLLVGIAFVPAAAMSKAPMAISVIGWFLAASAVALMILPRRWHSAYSTYWAGRIPVLAVRLMAPLSVIAGIVLIWIVV